MKMGRFLFTMLAQGVRTRIYHHQLVLNSFPIKLSNLVLNFPFLPPPPPLFSAAGFTEIVQVLLNSASSAECVKRMLETVDDEGDTVSSNNELNGFRVLLGGHIHRAE